MSKSKIDAHEDEHENAHAVVETENENDDELSEEENNIVATVATVGVVGIGAAVFEAALLPGSCLASPRWRLLNSCPSSARRLARYSSRRFAASINSVRRPRNSSPRPMSMSRTS